MNKSQKLLQMIEAVDSKSKSPSYKQFKSLADRIVNKFKKLFGQDIRYARLSDLSDNNKVQISTGHHGEFSFSNSKIFECCDKMKDWLDSNFDKVPDYYGHNTWDYNYNYGNNKYDSRRDLITYRYVDKSGFIQIDLIDIRDYYCQLTLKITINPESIYANNAKYSVNDTNQKYKKPTLIKFNSLADTVKKKFETLIKNKNFELEEDYYGENINFEIHGDYNKSSNTKLEFHELKFEIKRWLDNTFIKIPSSYSGDYYTDKSGYILIESSGDSFSGYACSLSLNDERITEVKQGMFD